MRKNLLALSIAAMVGGLSGAANAAVIETGRTATTLAPSVTGVGHILTVPYFSTQASNKSLLNIVNTDTVNGKAVKLRYRGAANSDDIFDITVYLSPGDMWTANVSADDAGYSRLFTEDNSCTLPSRQDIRDDNNGRFKTNRVQNGDAAQTREGYIEILNTADIPPTRAAFGSTAAGTANPLFTAIKHVDGTAPCTQSVMDLQENDLVDNAASSDHYVARGYQNPTGGLFANWVLVNVQGFASHSGEASAVVANGAGNAGNIVWFPQTTATLSTGTAAQFTADPLLAASPAAVQVANYDFPDLSTPYATALGTGAPSTQADQLTAALATRSVSNEYLTSGDFMTDWVFSMPTRRYHVALNYAAPVSSRLVFRTSGGTSYFNTSNTSLNAAGTQACVAPGALRGYDREEGTQTTFVISPSEGIRLCGETSVLAFNQTGASSVLDAKIARNDIKTRKPDGWMSINTQTGTSGGVIGLPVIGFAASKVSGANLGGTWEHRYSR